MKLPKHMRAFTLIEMLVTIFVFTVILIAVTNSVLFFYRANTTAVEEAFQIRSAERGMDVLVRDLREATYGDDGSYPLAEMASTSITFYSDIDHSSPIERIRYLLNNKLLTRTVINSTGIPPTYTGAAATTTVSEFVRNSEDGIALFQYFDKNGDEVTDPLNITDVVSVSVSIVVDITPQHQPGEFTLRSGATLRNLRPQ